MSDCHQVARTQGHLRGSIPWSKRSPVFATDGVDIVALFDLISQVLGDGAGSISDFELPDTRHPQQQVLIEDEAAVVSFSLIAGLHLPVQPIQQGAFCKLQAKASFFKSPKLVLLGSN